MDTRFERAAQLVEEGIQNGAYPAAVLSVSVGGKECLCRAFGKATTQTLFDMASVSKILAATMVAFRFIETGRLRLYDKVSLFFDAPEDKKNITILQLMTHTSGIDPHFYLSERTDDPANAASVILAEPLLHAPGEMPDYSCMGYILLGKILEQIGGAPLDVLAQEWVFGPLGMTHTTYRPCGDIAPTELDPATQKPFCGVVHDENARFLNGISANAGVFSDIRDMRIFADMLANGGKTADGTAFLSPAMLKKALYNYTPGMDEHRGLGFNLAGSPLVFLGDLLSPLSFGHTGFTGTSFAVDPETGLSVVLLTNRVCPTRENPKLIRMRSLIHNACAGAIRD